MRRSWYGWRDTSKKVMPDAALAASVYKTVAPSSGGGGGATFVGELARAPNPPVRSAATHCEHEYTALTSWRREI